MKVLSVGVARAFWVFDTAEINPGGKDIFTHLFPALLEEYKFKSYPKPGENFSQGLKFTNGEYVKEDGTVLVVNAAIFSDGVAAETFSSTKDAEEFLDTVLSDIPDLGFTWDPEMVRRKIYVSQLNVKCTGSLNSLNPALAEFGEQVSAATNGTAFGVAAIEFWPDQTQLIKPVNFSFQRKIGEPLDSNRYWSQAPLSTDKHIELLERLEILLSA
jgi:hypothetical protein